MSKGGKVKKRPLSPIPPTLLQSIPSGVEVVTHFKKMCAPTIQEKKGNHKKKYRVYVYYYARDGEKGEQRYKEYETREEAVNDQHNFRVELELGRKGNKIWAGISDATPMENEDASHYKYSQVNAVEQS